MSLPILPPPTFNVTKSIGFLEGVSLGLVKGWTTVNSFGHNESVGSTAEDICLSGGLLVYPTVAGIVTIVSTSSSDALGGIGAQSVQLIGLDGDYNVIQEVVDMNGTTPVTSTLSFLRINFKLVYTSGSSSINVGNITSSIAGNTQTTIDEGDGLNHDIHYCVPAGCTSYIMRVETWRKADKDAIVSLFYRPYQGTWISPGHIDTYRSAITVEVSGAVVLPEKTDLVFRAKADSSTVSATVYVTMLQKENNPWE